MLKKIEDISKIDEKILKNSLEKMKGNNKKTIADFFDTPKSEIVKNKKEIPEIKIKKIKSPINNDYQNNRKSKRSKSDDSKSQVKCSRLKTKNKSENFSRNEEKTQSIDEIKYQDQQLIKSLKEINENQSLKTSEKQNVSTNLLDSPDSIQEKSFKRASKTKNTLKVVMENYKRSPSILFSSPMQNVYLKDVFSKIFITLIEKTII